MRLFVFSHQFDHHGVSDSSLVFALSKMSSHPRFSGIRATEPPLANAEFVTLNTPQNELYQVLGGHRWMKIQLVAELMPALSRLHEGA